MEAISNACGFVCTSACTQLMKFLRLEALGTMIYSYEYKRPKRRNNYTITFSDESNHEFFGIVEYFVEVHVAANSQIGVLALVTILSTTVLAHGLSSELLTTFTGSKVK